jgi:hypothetical protein
MHQYQPYPGGAELPEPVRRPAWRRDSSAFFKGSPS